MSDLERKRSFVADLYPGRGWKKRVARMSDAQVLAIYLRQQTRPTEDTSEESEDDASSSV